LINFEPCWLFELSDLGTHPSGGSHKSRGARYVDKLLPERSWRFDFNTGTRHREKTREVPTSLFSLLEGSSQLPHAG